VSAKGGRGGRDFVARTLADIVAALERAVYAEEQARRPGLLQAVDPRAKLVALLLLVLTAALARSVVTVAAVYALAMLLAWRSQLSLRGLARRAWLSSALFAGVVVLPAAFTTPGQPLAVLLDLPPLRLVVTDDGARVALLFVTRVATSVTLATLLVLTTRWTDLLAALRCLRVPETFVVILGMTYRYLFLFLHAAGNLFQARASRTVGVTGGAEQRLWAARATGTLVSRSVKLSGDVHLAMQARGYDGALRSAHAFRLRDEDRLLLALAAAGAAALLLLDGRLG
jgi:cobalt ECF transporter T component CbiQ